MPNYNLYFMNSRGHIDGIEHVDAAGDDAAIDLACEKQGSRPIEIWSEHRKVHRIEALDENVIHVRRALDQLSRRQDTSNPAGETLRSVSQAATR